MSDSKKRKLSPNASLNIDICNCTDINSLIKYIKNNKHSFNNVNIATSLHRCVKLCRRHELHKNMKDVYDLLLPSLLQVVDTLNPQEVSNTCSDGASAS